MIHYFIQNQEFQPYLFGTKPTMNGMISTSLCLQVSIPELLEASNGRCVGVLYFAYSFHDIGLGYTSVGSLVKGLVIMAYLTNSLFFVRYDSLFHNIAQTKYFPFCLYGSAFSSWTNVKSFNFLTLKQAPMSSDSWWKGHS